MGEVMIADLLKNRRVPGIRIQSIACWFIISFLLTASPNFAEEVGTKGGVSPELLDEAKELFEQGKLSGEQLERAREAMERGEISAAELQKFKGTEGLGTLTLEEIEAGKRLLKERQKERALPEQEKKGPVEAEKEEETRWGEKEVAGSELKIFGHELFSKPPSTFAPITQVPVSDSYVIGPGDEIKVLMWGRVDAEYSLVVDNEGVIQFPKVGPLTVAGLTYQELKELIKRKAEAMTGVNVNISMGKLRTIQVFLLGEVKSPGVYTVSSLATMTNALLASGGPTILGSLRQVQLKRRGRMVTTVDFYDFLLRGDTSADTRLMPGDVIFVPQVGPMVAVAGNVRRQAIYELKEDQTLQRALKLAGGLAPQAYNQRIQIERASENQMKIVLDIPYEHLEQEKVVPLKDGDQVQVFPILEESVNAVYLYGNVSRPGKYAYKPGMRVLDVLPNLEMETLQPDTYLSYALIKRYKPDEMRAELIPFNLEKLLIESDLLENLKLQPLDEVYVFNKSVFEDKPEVQITGEVRKPGRYSIDKMRIKDLLYKAGGLTRDAYLPLGHLYRTDPKTFDVALMTFDLEDALKEVPQDNLLLQDQDEVVIHSIREYKPRAFVRIYGMVNNPGQYPLAVGMTIKDLIMAGGNLREEAHKGEAELVRFKLVDGDLMKTEVMAFNVAQALASDPLENFNLQDYDQVFIKRIPDWLEEVRVTIEGEVRYPGEYFVRDGERLSSLIERAGGFTQDAYLRGAFFTRERVRQIQGRRLADLILKMEQDLAAGEATEVMGVLSKEEVEAHRVGMEAKKSLLQKLKEAKVEGRMVVKLDQLERFKDSKFDLRVEDQDRLVIPKTPQSVNVLGEVYNATSFLYEKGKKVDYYLKRAGGPTTNAEKDEIYIVRADGSVQSKSQSGKLFSWDPDNNRWTYGGFKSATLYPGDSLLVPRKLVKIHWVKEFRDITQIIFQIAVAAGVVAAI
jgi:polysaccharide export outer membrane protein